MAIDNNGMEYLLNGRICAPIEEFPTRPEGAVLIKARKKEGFYQVYTTEEHVGKLLDMLIRGSTYSPIAVDPEKTNI